MEALFARRQAEADEFYAALQHDIADADARLVQRQALAGMLWTKQYYQFDVTRWHDGDPGQPKPPRARRHGRNADWRHMCNGDIVSMPDKWEYPWYASWDLAFHAVAFAMIDPDFAKKQLLLLVKERYMHPNGQLPAYEWAFGDANPPVHAWATWRVYELDREMTGVGDHEFLEVMFHKLLLNFSWWVNRKDADDRNIFQGGFLGLDNVGIFDRSSAAADRRPHRSGRRHGVDGLVRARPDADRPRTGDDEQRVRRNRGEVLRALSVYRGSGQLQRRLQHRAYGTDTTNSSMTYCTFRTAPVCRCAFVRSSG